jgi:hypothetical protein
MRHEQGSDSNDRDNLGDILQGTLEVYVAMLGPREKLAQTFEADCEEFMRKKMISRFLKLKAASKWLEETNLSRPRQELSRVGGVPARAEAERTVLDLREIVATRRVQVRERVSKTRAC